MKTVPIYEYCIEEKLDLANMKGVYGLEVVNKLALDGWEPFKMLSQDHQGYNARILFRRIISPHQRGSETPNG